MSYPGHRSNTVGLALLMLAAWAGTHPALGREIIYSADFSRGAPAGWSVVDGFSDGLTWNWADGFMLVDSDAAGQVDMDEELISPSIDCSGAGPITLRFHHGIEYCCGQVGDVDVRVRGGPWQNVARYTAEHAYGVAELNLTQIAAGQADVQVRWHFYNAFFAWFWVIRWVEVTRGYPDDVLQMSAAEFRVGEATGSIGITVKRPDGGMAEVAVSYATSDGTAVAGQDYVATSGVLHFGPTDTEKTFVVPFLNDGVREFPETFAVTLSNPTGGAILGAPASAVVTILDDDPPAAIYVDDNASGDPGPGDPHVSDPGEDGSPSHPFDAIDEAIDAASEGYEIVVAGGLYVGKGNHSLDFRGKSITLRAASPNDPNGYAGSGTPIIDLQRKNSALRFHRGESENAVVSGFVIRNGSANKGGAVDCKNASPTLRNCTICGNMAGDSGGAIYCQNASPRIINCTITANSAGTTGGIYASRNSRPVITNTIVWGNRDGTGTGRSAQIGGEGMPTVNYSCVTEWLARPPIYCWGFDEPSGVYAEKNGRVPPAFNFGVLSIPGVVGNGLRFPDNQVAYVSLGLFDLPRQAGSVEFWFKPLPIADRTAPYHILTKGITGSGPRVYSWHIYLGVYRDLDMISAMEGGGGASSDTGRVQFDQWQHVVETWSPEGVKFYLNGVQIDTVVNTGVVEAPPHALMPVALAKFGLRYYSEAAYRGDFDELKIYDYPLTPAEVAGAFAHPGPETDSNTATSSFGNVSGDPCFVDAVGPDGDANTVEDNDYHLSVASPCIDGGDPNGDYSGQTDTDGEPRRMGARVDIGSDEFTVPRVHNVTQDTYHERIQDAIDQAANGDELVLAPGRYTGEGNRQIDFTGKAITVRGPDPNDPNTVAATIIDLNQAGGGFRFHQGETATSMLAGVTITKASTAEGGAIFCDGSSPTIRGCILQHNSAQRGGGIFCTNGSRALITGCIIRENGVGRGIGAGICCRSGSSPTITDCLLESNAGGEGGGGAIHCDGSSSPLILRCTIANNGCSSGGGIQCKEGSNPTIRQCLFRYNTGFVYGGAVYCSASSPTLTNCIFVNSSTYYGGVLYCTAGSRPRIDHCTMSYSWAEKSGGVVYSTGDSVPVLSNCILYNSRDRLVISPAAHFAGDSLLVVTHCCIYPWNGPMTGSGNIFADPMLTPSGRLRSGSPCIDAGDPNGRVDPNDALDIDGEERIVGARADIGADEFKDSDADGLPDAWEFAFFGPTGDAEPNVDPDGDGLTNLQEYADFGTHPNTPPCFVDGASGNDAYDGATSAYDGVHGPKKTIQAAIDGAAGGDTAIVLPGVYAGPGNRDLAFSLKTMVIRSRDGAQATTIDAGETTPGATMINGRSYHRTLQGFMLTGGKNTRGGAVRVGDGSVVRDCVIAGNTATIEGGGLFGWAAWGNVNNLTIGSNAAPSGAADAAVFELFALDLRGDLRLEAGRTDLRSSWIDGPGTVRLAHEAVLKVTGQPGNLPTEIRSNIDGTGRIEIDAGCQLILGNNAVLDLHREPNDVCGDATGGQVTIYGTLLARDNAVIRRATVCVNEARFEGTNTIEHSTISLGLPTTGMGGQFYVEGAATIRDNAIFSEGDRYLDLDPDPAALQRPTVSNNLITVRIPPSATNTTGSLLELRARDYDAGGPVNPQSRSGIFQVSASSPGFTPDPSANWVLEKLTLEPNSQLNLTNRPGFQYQADLTYPESIYVKELVLAPASVLNTALQSLYYRDLILVDESGNEMARNPDPNTTGAFINGSRIVDVPLLGFSLGLIAMEDDTEFGVRVRMKVMAEWHFDPNDPNSVPFDPSDPNRPAFDPNDPNVPAGSIRRAVGLLPGRPAEGVMEMRTHEPGRVLSMDSVLAKGSFARAAEEQITVAFEYLFMENPNAELIVYLSDRHDPTARNVELARIRPPASNHRGAIGSSEFATFRGTFPRGSLNFMRGVYVGLELRGQDARCLIDNWDPQIDCLTENTCMEVDGLPGVTAADYLLLLAAASGQASARMNRWSCADIALNNYVDLDDVIMWDAALGVLNLCGEELTVEGGTAPAPFALTAPILPASQGSEASGSMLVITGKSNSAFMRTDFHYAVDPDTGTLISKSQLSGPEPNVADGGGGRLITDAAGRLYQIHGTYGLVNCQTGQAVVLPAMDKTFEGKAVWIGVNRIQSGPSVGVPLTDAAFSPSDANVVYVVPVLVTPTDGGCRYRAAAKLSLRGSGQYDLDMLYGTNPDIQDDCGMITPETDVYQPREIEVDGSGNVFVLSTQYLNDNDWILIYRETEGTPTERRVLVSRAVENPTAMRLSTFDDARLYAASASGTFDQTTIRVYTFTVERVGDIATGLAHALSDPNDPNRILYSTTDVADMRRVVSLVEEPNNGTLHVVGFTCPTMDPNDSNNPNPDNGYFTAPRLAVIEPNTAEPVSAQPIQGCDLALPLSAVFVPAASGHRLTVQVWHGDYGSVQVEPNQTIYPAGTPITLTAEPISGRGFSGWAVWGDPNRYPDGNYITIQDSNTVLHLVMDQDYLAEATFKCGSGIGTEFILVVVFANVCLLQRSRLLKIMRTKLGERRMDRR